MTLISDGYRKLNAEMHASRDDFGVSGGKWAPIVINLADSLKARSVLDYGCGRGLLKQEITKVDPHGYLDVREYDPAILAKSGAPEPADLVYCGDVMEHVEPECVASVFDDIKQLAILGVLFVIATRPAGKTLPDGRNAHLIVADSEWWLPQILSRWELDSFKRMGEMAFVAGGLCRR